MTWIHCHRVTNLELQVDAIDGRAVELQLHRVVLSERVRQVCTQKLINGTVIQACTQGTKWDNQTGLHTRYLTGQSDRSAHKLLNVWRVMLF